MDQFEERQEFEVHVTIKPTDNTTIFTNICDKFTEYANNLGISDAYVYSCKPIIIVLPTGVFKQQPMCSMFVSATLQNAIKFGEIFADFVKQNHKEYEFARNKVEARFRNVKGNLNLDIYKNNSLYWEFHFKLLLNRDEEKIGEFRKKLEKNFPNTRLSRSAMSKHETQGNPKTSRIVTLRIYSGDKINAKYQYDRVEAFLLKNEFKKKFCLELLHGTEMELSVYDTNVNHDAGWIQTEGSNIKTQNLLCPLSGIYMILFSILIVTFIKLFLI
jgi:hypothetical protein